jgi:hypothetical protein
MSTALRAPTRLLIPFYWNSSHKEYLQHLKPLNVTIVVRFATAKDQAMEGPNAFL